MRVIPPNARTHSQYLCGLAGGSAALESTTDGAGTIAYLPGLATDATGTAADLSAARRGGFREVRGARENGCVCVRAATCAAVSAV